MASDFEQRRLRRKDATLAGHLQIEQLDMRKSLPPDAADYAILRKSPLGLEIIYQILSTLEMSEILRLQLTSPDVLPHALQTV